MVYDFYNPPEEHLSCSKEDSSKDKLIADSILNGQNKREKPMEVTDFGQIESIILSNGWSTIPQAEGVVGQPRKIEFKQANNSSLSFREKGYRISEAGGALFVSSLNKPLNTETKDRVIDLNTEAGKEEYLALQPVLAEDLANTNKFKPELVRIREINGRRVLEITGSRGNLSENGIWTSSGQKITSLYIDKFGQGDAIQEIHLEANEKFFNSLKIEFEQALKTLKWK